MCYVSKSGTFFNNEWYVMRIWAPSMYLFYVLLPFISWTSYGKCYRQHVINNLARSSFWKWSALSLPLWSHHGMNRYVTSLDVMSWHTFWVRSLRLQRTPGSTLHPFQFITILGGKTLSTWSPIDNRKPIQRNVEPQLIPKRYQIVENASLGRFLR